MIDEECKGGVSRTLSVCLRACKGNRLRARRLLESLGTWRCADTKKKTESGKLDGGKIVPPVSPNIIVRRLEGVERPESHCNQLGLHGELFCGGYYVLLKTTARANEPKWRFLIEESFAS